MISKLKTELSYVSWSIYYLGRLSANWFRLESWIKSITKFYVPILLTKQVLSWLELQVKGNSQLFLFLEWEKALIRAAVLGNTSKTTVLPIIYVKNCRSSFGTALKIQQSPLIWNSSQVSTWADNCHTNFTSQPDLKYWICCFLDMKY